VEDKVHREVESTTALKSIPDDHLILASAVKNLVNTLREENLQLKRELKDLKSSKDGVSENNKESTPSKREKHKRSRSNEADKKQATEPIKQESEPIKKETTPIKKETTPIKKETEPIDKETEPIKKERRTKHQTASDEERKEKNKIK